MITHFAKINFLENHATTIKFVPDESDKVWREKRKVTVFVFIYSVSCAAHVLVARDESDLYMHRRKDFQMYRN